jgi:D-erythrulose 1-phosphate 3-epimerase
MGASMTRFTLGTNLCFAINRFPEPESWAELVSEQMGLHSVQLVSDLLHPFWPEDVLERQTRAVQEATARHSIAVHSLMTGTFSRTNHLMFPQDDLRTLWFGFFKRFVDLGAALGALSIGSHFGVLSMRDVSDVNRYRTRVDEAVRLWQELSFYAREKGLQYLYYEPMSVPREMGYTISQARELYERLNAHAGVPIKLCLDVGHAPHPMERDPYPWLEALGAHAPIVHLQQTEAGHSRHWPFTSEYNAQGIVDPLRVLEMLSATEIDDVWLGFEILHRERYEQEAQVIPDNVRSAAYWRQYIPVDGQGYRVPDGEA